MATLLRTASRVARLGFASYSRRRQFIQPSCLISTSKKKEGITTSIDAVEDKKELEKKLEEHFGDDDLDSKKNWISYGYSYTDKEMDSFYCHMTLFISITLIMVGGSFLLVYQPDIQSRDWTMREAYLELERREKKGLPFVDPNLIDPAKINLPSEEELNDVEIII